MNSYLFITGAGRSGTTLLDKMISMHPEVLVFSQPLPLIYVAIKKSYMHAFKGTTTTPEYPLNDLFAENYRDPEAFMEYLWVTRFPNEFFKKVLSSMLDYKGQYTKPACEFKLIGRRRMSLFQFFTRYTEWLSSKSSRDCSISGAKETFTEEYIPYYITCGAKVIQIIRDPRDVLASLSYGAGGKFSGSAKPHLFNIRQWRKSIAYALKVSSDSQYLFIRYEDLILKPLITMNRIARFLEIDVYSDDTFSQEIVSQSGEIWDSNSSYESSFYLNSAPIGNYMHQLPVKVKRFIEACCYYEMKLFDYRPEINENEIEIILSNYEEIVQMGRDDLKSYYWTDARRREEWSRVQGLKNNSFMPQRYIFREAFHPLKEIAGF